eukprot:m.66162 g.66162  ORF g.66162 m.66162 type:complete len:509 (+) comp12104_c0_seq2:156-1682(+)
MSQAQVALSPQHTMHSESPQRKDGQIAKQQKAESDQDSEGDEDFGFEEATCPPAPGLATSSTSPYALPSSKQPGRVEASDEGSCLCGQPEKGFMISCDGCNLWFHGPCVQVTPSFGNWLEQNDLEWYCPRCLQRPIGSRSVATLPPHPLWHFAPPRINMVSLQPMSTVETSTADTDHTDIENTAQLLLSMRSTLPSSATTQQTIAPKYPQKQNSSKSLRRKQASVESHVPKDQTAKPIVLSETEREMRSQRFHTLEPGMKIIIAKCPSNVKSDITRRRPELAGQKGTVISTPKYPCTWVGIELESTKEHIKLRSSNFKLSTGKSTEGLLPIHTDRLRRSMIFNQLRIGQRVKVTQHRKFNDGNPFYAQVVQTPAFPSTWVTCITEGDTPISIKVRTSQIEYEKEDCKKLVSQQMPVRRRKRRPSSSKMMGSLPSQVEGTAKTGPQPITHSAIATSMPSQVPVVASQSPSHSTAMSGSSPTIASQMTSMVTKQPLTNPHRSSHNTTLPQ